MHRMDATCILPTVGVFHQEAAQCLLTGKRRDALEIPSAAEEVPPRARRMFS